MTHLRHSEKARLYRDPNQTLAKYRALVRRLDQNRREYDPVLVGLGGRAHLLFLSDLRIGCS